MARLYSVTLQSQSLPVTFNVVTVPNIADGITTTPSKALESLGLRIYDPFLPDSEVDASIRLANLVAFTLSKRQKRSAREMERLLDANAADLHQFTAWVASQEFIPVEASPLHGVSLGSLLKKGSLAGLAVFTEGYGMTHHDPVMCIIALPMTIIVGATIGAAEAVRERVKELLGAKKQKKKTKKKS